jgi:hypothetical protein
MARQQIAENEPVQAQQGATALDVADRPLYAGEVLPARLSAIEVAKIWGIGLSRFYALASQGKFDAFEILPQIGRRAWSGERIGRYLRGEPVFTRSFGRKAR